MKDMIQAFKNQIDTIDEEMIYLLSRRFELIKQLNNIEGTEPENKRREDIMINLEKEAIDKGVSKILVHKIWDQIKKESDRKNK